MSKGIVWEVFWTANVNTFVGVESLGEVVTIDDAENSRVDIKIAAEFQIGPIDKGCVASLGQFVSLKEDSLRNSRVLNAALNDVDGVIVKIVVKNAFADSIVLSWVLHYWLLEVGFEVKHLNVTVRVSYQI